MRFDLHIHSNHSDGRSSVEEILLAARSLGLNGVAITDHNTLEGSIAAIKAARSLYPEMLVIRGAEVSTSEGHLLVLGVSELPPLRRSPEETIEAVHDLGGIANLPHPFHPFRHAIGRIPPVDAVEVYNSKYILGVFNARAKWEARKRNLPTVAGSDSHMVETIGLGVTEIDASSADDVLEEIRRGRTSVSGHRTSPRLIAERKIGKACRDIKNSMRNKI